ncbi:MAG: coproporphyrinogen-III oxidase family protein, partial [Planctomycetota bacterium]
MPTGSLAPPRSSYLHVPFCARRCGYCNFAVVADRLDLADDYLRAVALELERTPGEHPVDTLYFGGGTPTELPADKLATLCETVLRHRTPTAGCEWTIEANPLDVTDRDAAVWLAARGINRVSLGAQSLNPAKLKRLERDHSPRDVRRAVEHLRSAGLSVAIDLIFAAPDESFDDWRRDLEAVVDLRPDHVSTYGLTYEPGAEFWGRLKRGQLVERPEELQRDMYAYAIDRLGEAGFEHYEISNFARPGLR